MLRILLLPVWLVLVVAQAQAACSPAALNTLLTTDADSLGFPALITAGNDAMILTLANQQRPGATYQIIRDAVPSREVVRAFNPTEFAALTTVPLQKLTTMLSAGTLDFTDANIRDILRDIWPSGGPTRAALTALAVRQGSWAELRCGQLLTLRDISFALRSTQ